MTTDTTDLIERAKKARTAVYLATDALVADDLSGIIDGLLKLIPEPPTNDEREAVEAVVRNVYDPWSNAPSKIADAIVHSAPWRNRHRGPIAPEGPAFIAQMPPLPETSTRWWSMYCRECGIEECMAEAADAPLLVNRRDEHNRQFHGTNRHRGPIADDGDARHVDALRDLAEHGLRFDLNPTMAITTATEVYAQWAAYARRMDESVRAHARAALEAAGAA